MKKNKSSNDFQYQFIQVSYIIEISLVNLKGDHASVQWFEYIFVCFFLRLLLQSFRHI